MHNTQTHSNAKQNTQQSIKSPLKQVCNCNQSKWSYDLPHSARTMAQPGSPLRYS